MKVVWATLPILATAGNAPATAKKGAKNANDPLVLPAAFDATTATAAPGSPNILVLMVDDLGFGDVSFSAGVGSNEDLDTAKATPTLTALAAEGVVLSSFYAQPSCTPSRASFMTGKYTTSIGLQDSVIQATEPRGLSLDEDILPQRLAAVGYRTMGVGKWHLGFHQPQYVPTQRGFEEYFGILTGGGGHYDHLSTAAFSMRGPYKSLAAVELQGLNLWHNGEAIDDADALVNGRHSTDIYTNVAVAQLAAAHASGGSGKKAAAPFFMYMSYQAIHAPMEVPPHYVDGTVDNGCDAIGSDSTLHGNNRKVLCGMVSHVDASVATIVDHLKSDALGNAWDNTVLFFLSDNGGVIAHGSSNAPFSGEKGTYYEGGMRVPAFIGGGFTAHALAATGTLPYASNAIVHISDLHATILTLATAPYTTAPTPTSTSTSTNDAAADSEDAASRRQLLLDAATTASPAAAAAAGASQVSSLLDPVPALDGVSQWDFLVSGGVAAAMPRTELLHNMNSELFGSGGALRLGDYKLLVEPKVSESEVYTYAQHVLQDGDFDKDELSMVVTKKLLKNDGTVKIFNVAKNPSEADLVDASTGEDLCGEYAEACRNLAGNEAFKQVEIALLDAWKQYRDSEQGVASTVAFQDDGPLCSPQLLGGHWAPWRDEEGLPYATYATVAQSSHFLAEEVEGEGSSSSSSSSEHANADKGDSDGSGSKTWKQQTKATSSSTSTVDLAVSSSSASSSSSPSASSSPLALVGAGSVLGALLALAAVVGAHRVRGRAAASSGYVPVASTDPAAPL